MTSQHKSFIRTLKCISCGTEIGGVYIESVWEEKDEKTYKLLHPLCPKCVGDYI